MRGLIAAVVSIALSGQAFGQAAALSRIGAAGAVKGVVNAQAPGAAAGRVIESGKTLFLNDHVTTNLAGHLQVLLLDETVFTMGPNSDMVLDEFVYDPANDKGKVAARVTKGVFRFVTGKVARRDPANMSVKLPAGTIGIRGTIVIGQVDGDKETVILGGPGGHTNTDDSRGAFLFDGKMVDAPGYGITCEAGKCSGVRDLSEQANRINKLLAATVDPNGQHGDKAHSGTRSSEQQTAKAKDDLIQSLMDDAAEQMNTVLLANQANDPRNAQNGISTWDELRANPQLGNVTYQSPSVGFACSGALCGPTPLMDFNLTVNFAARNYSANVQTSGSFGLDSNSASGSFANLSGAATVPFTGNFNGTAVTLFNSGGEIAKTATMNLKWNNISSGVSGTGSVSASR